MEALSGPPRTPPPPPNFEPNSDRITRRLLKHGVDPTPKIIHTLRKKQLQKHNRLAAKSPSPPLSAAQTRALAEDSAFRTMKLEYRALNRDLSTGREELDDLREMFEIRRRDELRWVLEDDVEVEKEWLDHGGGELRRDSPRRRKRNETEVVRFLIERISCTRMVRADWKLPRMMKQSGLEFTEGHLLRIVGELGSKKDCWERALSVVEWAYSDKDKKRNKSRFVYTKLLSVLGKARRFKEALKVFETMLGDYHIYPDMAAYHSIAVTLGQAGRLRDLIKVTECMRDTPSKKVKHLHNKNWDPALEPDIVVYNAVLNACVSSHQWKGVSWVFKQIRATGLKPNGATYGLAMEVMLESGKYELVYEYFQRMNHSGETPKALTYKDGEKDRISILNLATNIFQVMSYRRYKDDLLDLLSSQNTQITILVKAFSSEGKVKEAVEAVREMEQRGVVGASSVYYVLACCLCSNGMWKDAMLEVGKMCRLSDSRPLEVTFTGMITSSMHAGHIDDCISIFEHMKNHCSPNVGTVNIMLKVYGHNDMFSKAKALFEETKRTNIDPSSEDLNVVVRDEFTYGSMLEASAMALQWEYFEYVYKEMVLSGCKLDQTRHSWLLLQASKAGKSHLLEHACDAILKAGEIPNPHYFTEMLLQAMARDDYDRCVALVDTMSLAPFQFTEAQWKEIFELNASRISRAHLEKLSDSLKNCEVKSEATVLNLSKALRRSLCEHKLSISRQLRSEEEISAAPEKTTVVTECSEEEEIIGDDESDFDEELAHSLDVSLREISVAHDHTRFEELFFNGVYDESDKSDLPSATEVLEGWKESRKKDGKFSSGLGF